VPTRAIATYRYSSTQGVLLSTAISQRLFPHAGRQFSAAVGSLGAFKDERFLALRLSTFPTAHVHRDVGSFELTATATI